MSDLFLLGGILNPLRWFLDLTPHELDVLRTVSIVIGTGCTPVLGLLLGWGIKLLRKVTRDAEAAKNQTRREEHVNGSLHTVSVAEDMKRAMYSTEELTHLITESPRVHGRRRNTPTNTTAISHYEGLTNE